MSSRITEDEVQGLEAGETLLCARSEVSTEEEEFQRPTTLNRYAHLLSQPRVHVSMALGVSFELHLVLH